MNDAPDWPVYPVGPKDSILAIGTVSINYSRLESVLTTMFATITGSSIKFASILVPKITNNVRIDMMRRMLEGNDWPEDVRERAEHFITAFSILVENRNLLMHSSLFDSIQTITMLYKTTSKGSTQISRTTPTQLRQIADDMMTYFHFGMQLSNMINFELLGLKPSEGDFAYFSWPDKPPLPVRLDYTSNPLRG